MNKNLSPILREVRKPSRYLGNEKNAVRKELTSTRLKVALCYPDTYEIGMSHIGTQILYHLLNDRPEIACERVYAPWTDMEAKLRENGLPLTTLESNIPLRELDILGITLPYELTYTNILTILNLGDIPFYAKDRDETYPLVIGGGTGAYNPEPVADFLDAILIGDGEDAILEICEVIKKWKSEHRVLSLPYPPAVLAAGGGCALGGGPPPVVPPDARTTLLYKLAQIRGIYVPSFFQPEYNDDGTLKEIKPLTQGYTGVRKRIVSDLNRAYYPRRPILPHAKVIHDRVGVEVQRGCVRGCRFCQAGSIDRPERQRSPETVKEIVRNQIAATGQEAVSLVSLSIGDYDCLSPLLKDLMDEHAHRHVAISIPATRVEQLTSPLLEEIKRVRKTGFTIAPEAATDRMRNVINKGNSEENLMATARAVFSHGWNLMKFYFMTGLPTETDEEVTAIAEVGSRVLEEGLKFNKKVEINLGVSAFVPKSFTPFQWEPQNSLEETRRKLALLRSRLKSRRLHLKPHRAETTYLEGIFSRGDRRLSRLIVRAWEKGCRFDEWDEGLRYPLWMEACQETGIDPKFYVERRRGKEEVLPWDHLFIQMKKDWLWKEYEAALTASFVDDCSTGKCTVCGVCDYKKVRNRAYELPRFDETGKPVKRKTTTEVRLYQIDPPAGSRGQVVEGPRTCLSPTFEGSNFAQGSLGPEQNCGTNSGEFRRTRNDLPMRYRCSYTKSGPAVFLSHLEMVDAIRRAAARAGLPVRFSQGFHPLPRISFGDAAPVGKEVSATFTLELLQPVAPKEVVSLLNGELPEGMRVTGAEGVSKSAPEVLPQVLENHIPA